MLSDKTTNTLFYFLVFIILFSFLGEPIVNKIKNMFIHINNFIENKIEEWVSIFGYSTGAMLNKSSQSFKETSEKGLNLIDDSTEQSTIKGLTHSINKITQNGIDMANNTIQQIGNKLISVNGPNLDINTKKSLHQTLQYNATVSPDMSESSIQKPISSNESSWCLVNKYENGNDCIEISEFDKCISGQIFPSKQKCMSKIV